jgi:hypothetical protein
MGEIRRPMYDRIINKHLATHGITYFEARTLQTLQGIPPMVQEVPVYWNPSHPKDLNYHEQPQIQGMPPRHEPSMAHIAKDEKIYYGTMPRPHRQPGIGNRPLILEDIPDHELYLPKMKGNARQIKTIYKKKLERDRQEWEQVKKKSVTILKKVEAYKKAQAKKMVSSTTPATDDQDEKLRHDRDSYTMMMRKRKAEAKLRNEAKQRKTR